MTREEAINEIKSWDFLEGKEIEAIHTLIPDLAESEDKRMVVKIARTLSFAAAHNLIIDYDELIAMQNWLEKQKNLDKMIVVSPEVWDKAIADAFENGKKEGEKQKEPHYTKRNALFDKCVENCDPEVMKEVSDNVDKMLDKEQKPWKVGANAYFTPEQKPAEWSEEDEKNLNDIIHFFESLCSCLATEERHAENRKWLKFLKSLRPSWKPSDEQIIAVEHAYNSFPNDCPTKTNLRHLYFDLKKLT